MEDHRRLINRCVSKCLNIGLHSSIGFYIFLFIYLTSSGCVVTTSTTEIYTTEVPPQFAMHLQTLRDRYELTGTLKTTSMKVTIQESDSGPEEIREMLWYKRLPDGGELLRIQALGGFNDTKGVAIANRNQFLLRLLDEQEAYLGALSDGILREIFGIDLRVSDVLSAIFANPFLDGRIQNMEITATGNKFVVTRPGIESNHTETITIDIQDEVPRVSEWVIRDSEGDVNQSVIFSDYRETDSILRPHTVKIERPLEQTRVVVKIGDVKLNEDIDDSHFDFEPFLTEDIKIIQLSKSVVTDVPE